jgi:hypothetical protein
MKKVIVITMIALSIGLFGCQRGDFRVSPIIEGQKALHAGYNVGPELYLEEGQPAKVTGAVIWIRGFDPNDL